jgi:hypothetical protein
MNTLLATALQSGIDIDLGAVDPVGGVVSGAVGAFVTTLVVGAILVAVAPGYLERMTGAVRAEPVGSFLYGLLCLVGVFLVIVVLFITLIGIPVALLFALGVYLLWAVGAAVAFLAIAVGLVDPSKGWLKPLLLAAAFNGGLTLTGVGGIVAFCIGAAGFGAVLSDWLE